MTGTPQVRIDFLPESVANLRTGECVVAVDVFRATTTAVTAVLTGGRVFPAASLDDAQRLAGRLVDPLLIGELGGHMPYDFDGTNSPAAIERRPNTSRPIVLLSSSGTQLLTAAAAVAPTYVACLRNYTAQAEALIGRSSDVVIIGAGTRGAFREEDQLCCARIAGALLTAGFTPADAPTLDVVDRWRNADVTAITVSDSVRYLKRTAQLADLNFVLDHVDDVNDVYMIAARQVVRVDAEA